MLLAEEQIKLKIFFEKAETFPLEAAIVAKSEIFPERDDDMHRHPRTRFHMRIVEQIADHFSGAVEFSEKQKVADRINVIPQREKIITEIGGIFKPHKSIGHSPTGNIETLSLVQP